MIRNTIYDKAGTCIAKTEYEYDQLNRLVKETKQDENIQYIYTYDDLSCVVRKRSINTVDGSVTSITDKEGTVIASYSYSTYGYRTTEFGDENEIIGYNGIDGVLTDPNGLYYMRMRYYCVELDRFINEDILTGNIVNSLSLNRYAYVQGNPVTYVDPTGMYPKDPGKDVCEKQLWEHYKRWKKSHSSI